MEKFLKEDTARNKNVKNFAHFLIQLFKEVMKKKSKKNSYFSMVSGPVHFMLTWGWVWGALSTQIIGTEWLENSTLITDPI